MPSKKDDKSLTKTNSKFDFRKQIRELPLLECLINHDWELSKVAEIIIARKHHEGHISYASYLVDLLCMGIKDSTFDINITASSYKKYKKELKSQFSLVPIDYPLAHHIIFSGYAFAIDLGIEPCSVFVETTQFLLNRENDSSHIPPIECGENGLPVILRDEENFDETTDLYNFLCTTIGKEKVIIREIDDDYNDEPAPLEDFIYINPEEELKRDITRYREISKNPNNIQAEESFELFDIADRLFYNYYGYEVVNDVRNKIFDFFDIDTIDTELPDEVLGFSASLYPSWVSVVDDILTRIEANEQNTDPDNKLDYDALIKNHPQIPFFKYLYIREMEFDKMEKGSTDDQPIMDRIDEFIAQNPTYALLKTLREIYNIRYSKSSVLAWQKIITSQKASTVFNDRELIHPTELILLVTILFEYYVTQEDRLAIDSLIACVESDFPYTIDYIGHLLMANNIFKVHFCNAKYL